MADDDDDGEGDDDGDDDGIDGGEGVKVVDEVDTGSRMNSMTRGR